MKMIHLVVASCKKCPYLHIINNCVYYCKLQTNTYSLIGIDYRERVYDGKIPMWCELPDNYNQEDDGEIE